MPKGKTFIEKTQPKYIVDIMSEDVLEMLLDSYRFPLQTPLMVFYIKSGDLQYLGLPDEKDQKRFNSPFCYIYQHTPPKCVGKCRKCDEKITRKYDRGAWQGPKLFHCHLRLWEMTYPLFVQGWLMGVLYGGQIIVTEPVEDWTKALKKIKDEVVWDPFETNPMGIPKKSNQMDEIHSAINGAKELNDNKKKRLITKLKKEKKKKVDASQLLERYDKFKKFGKTMEHMFQDLDAVKRRNLELAALVKAAHSVNSDLRLSEVLDAIIESGLDVMKYKGGAISLYVLRHLSDDREFIVTAGGGHGFRKMYVGMRFPDKCGLAGQVLQSGHYDVSPCVSEDPNYFSLVKNMKSAVVVPIKWGKQIVGTLSMGSSHESAFDDNDAKLLEGFAEQVAIALRNAINNEKIQGQIHVQNKCAETIVRGAERTEVCHGIVDSVSKTLNTRACSLFLYDGFGKLWLSATTDSRLKKRMEKKSDVFYNVGEGLTGWVAKSRRVLRIKDIADAKYLASVSRDLKWKNKFPEHLKQSAKTKTFLGTPICFRNELLGVIRAAQKKDSDIFLPDDEEILGGIAGQAAIAIKFIDSLEEVTKANEQLGLAIGGFAHDAGEPSSNLHVDLSALHNEVQQPVSVHCKLFDLMCQSEHLKYLVGTYRTIGIADKNEKIKLDKVKEIEIAATIDRIVMVARGLFGERDSKIKVGKIKISNSIPKVLRIVADAGKMHAIFYNLIINAIKACRKKVEISCRQDKKSWRFSILNDGESIEEGDIPKELMFKHLGVYICRRFVEAHGGFLDIHKLPGRNKGTIAELSIPKNLKNSV